MLPLQHTTQCIYMDREVNELNRWTASVFQLNLKWILKPSYLVQQAYNLTRLMQ